MDKFLIIGNGAREAIFAKKLAIDSKIYAVMGHENPTIINAVKSNEGDYMVGDINDNSLIIDFAKKNSIDYVFVNSDAPLANGLVDDLMVANVKVIGPTKQGARIEWDKSYSIELVNNVAPNFTPKYIIVKNISQIDNALSYFNYKDIVVKPQGLTAGKGVKVMGEHLENIDEVIKYIQYLIDKGGEVLLCEKLQGFEFTIMGITDGSNFIFSPATYDYPYRNVGDSGPGTGGMGCFTDNKNILPFLSQSDYDDCCKIMKNVVQYMSSNNIHFNGVINGGFFLTKKGIKFMEFNSRFGDPEALNILSVMQCSFSKLLLAIYNKNLDKFDCNFLSKASVVKYLVSNEYPEKGPKISFNLDVLEINKNNIDVYFSAARAINEEGNLYQTVSSSRVVALCCVADNIVEASNKLNNVINSFIDKINLDYRPDIGSESEVEKLTI